MFSVKTISAAAFGAAAIGLSVSSLAPAEAATVRRDPNNSNFVVGVDDIDIAGVTYNVNFARGIFANLYGAPADNNSTYALNPFWGSQTDALSAANALVAVLNAENPVPTGTSQINNGFSIPTQVSFAPGIGNVLDASFGSFSPSTSSWNAGSRSGALESLNQTYATFAVVPSTSIPTPALLPGLLGMGIAAWKKRKGEPAEQVAETAEV